MFEYFCLINVHVEVIGNLWNQFSPSTLWVPRNQTQSWDLVVGIFKFLTNLWIQKISREQSWVTSSFIFSAQLRVWFDKNAKHSNLASCDIIPLTSMTTAYSPQHMAIFYGEVESNFLPYTWSLKHLVLETSSFALFIVGSIQVSDFANDEVMWNLSHYINHGLLTWWQQQGTS